MICSLDTNIFVYCIDATDAKKHQAALALLARAIDAVPIAVLATFLAR